MKRLPYLRYLGSAVDIEFIYSHSRAFVHIEDYEIRGGRDPDRFSYKKPRPDFQQAEWKTASKVTWKRIQLGDPDYETDNDDELEPEVLTNGQDD